MAIQPFLAMTGAEIAEKAAYSHKIAWMACHFSPYGTGLSNIPKSLPQGSMIILNDRIPVCGHDPELITEQLKRLVAETKCSTILLDFQRPDVPETAGIVSAILEKPPCPVGVSECYAHELVCPVFLPPVPPHVPLAKHVAPWQGREIWLELALDGTEIAVTPEGSKCKPLPALTLPENCHHEPKLHCHYDITTETERIRFRLSRTPEDLNALLNEAKELGVTQAIGLYQEMRNTELTS